MKLKHILLLFFFGNILFSVVAQENIAMGQITDTPTEWGDYFQNEKIKIEVSEFSCNDVANAIYNNYKIFRVTNKTNSPVEISFQQEMWYNNNQYCIGCEGGSEYQVKILLESNESMTGSCTSPSSELRIFKDSPDGFKSTLSRFELKNITATAK